jgi:hypothetical protein
MVIGFLFNDNGSQVLLRQSPIYSERRCGIGGKVEDGESDIIALSRHFLLEGLDVSSVPWVKFCDMLLGPKGEEDLIVRYYLYHSSTLLEPMSWPGLTDTRNLSIKALHPDLMWLIPMALSMWELESTKGFIIKESF